MTKLKYSVSLFIVAITVLASAITANAITVDFSGRPDAACSGQGIIPYGPGDLLYQGTQPLLINSQYSCINLQLSNSGVLSIDGGLTPDGQPDISTNNIMLTGQYYDTSTGTNSPPVPLSITFGHSQRQIAFDLYANVGCTADTVPYTLKDIQGNTLSTGTITAADVTIVAPPPGLAIIAGRVNFSPGMIFDTIEFGLTQGGSCTTMQGSVAIDNLTYMPYAITTTASPNGTVTPPQPTLRVDFGSIITYTFTPNQGYMVGDLTIDGASLGSNITSHTFDGINADHSISVTFSPQTYTIAATAGPGGTITPSGTAQYPASSSQTFTITPDPGYAIAEVLVDGTSQGTPGLYVFSGINANHTISATFTATTTYTITATAGTNGSISPAGTVNVPQGSSKSFTFAPNQGYRIGTIVVDGMPKPLGSAYTFTNVQQPHTINVTFVLDVYTITAVASPTAGGTLTPPGATSVNAGASVTYTISTNPTYRLVNVAIDSSNQGPVTSYTLNNINSNHTVTAYFEQIKYTVTATAGPNGTITQPGAIAYPIGSNPSFTVTADPGYHVANVTVDSVPQGAITSYTFQNITSDHTINVTFDPNPTYTITATSDPNGQITPSGSVQVLGGTSKVFTWTANPGYRLATITIDGAPKSLGSSYNFTNVSANHTISVTFTPDVYTITAVASPSAGGSLSPSGITTLPSGASQAYTISTNQGYNLSNVVIDGVSMGPITSYSFNAITFNHTISAYYTKITYNITSTATTGGTISPNGNIAYNYGSTPTFTITPTTGYHIKDILVDGTSMGQITSYTFPPLTAAHTIAAQFDPNPTYTIMATSDANGSISPSGAIQALGGTRQTFTFTANAGFRLGSITVDGAIQRISSSYTFNNIWANHTIAAAFIPDTYTITASASPAAGGTISPAGATTVNSGGGQSYTITTNQGYTLTDVVVNGVSQGPIASYSFSNVKANQTITARYRNITYTIAATAGANGSISPSGNLTYKYGSTPSFNITPTPGYHIADVLVDGTSVGATPLYAFQPLAGNHTISATFDINPTYTITAISGPNGTITPTGATPVLGGTNQTFTFTPDQGYRIGSITVDAVPKRISSTYTFSRVSADHTISVTFVPDTLTISAYAYPAAGGTITPSGTLTYTRGDTQTFTIATNPGYILTDVLVDGVFQGPIASYTFTNVSTNHSISAYYAIQ